MNQKTLDCFLHPGMNLQWDTSVFCTHSGHGSVGRLGCLLIKMHITYVPSKYININTVVCIPPNCNLQALLLPERTCSTSSGGPKYVPPTAPQQPQPSILLPHLRFCFYDYQSCSLSAHIWCFMTLSWPIKLEMPSSFSLTASFTTGVY